MDIDEYQRLSRETDHIVRRDINYLVPLLGLNEHIGLLTAILRREAYRMRGLIMEHNGGGVTANLDTQTLVFTPPQAK